MIPDKKVCGQCYLEKDKSEFSIRKKGKDGQWQWLRLECKACENKKRRLWYQDNKEKVGKRNKKYTSLNKEEVSRRKKVWQQKNKDTIIDNRRKYYIKNNKIVREKRKEYYYANKAKCIESVVNYQKKNLIHVRSMQRKRHRVKKATNCQYNMVRVLRGRVFAALKKKGVKCERTKILVGCSIPFLIKYIEGLFTDGMTWENQGLRGWHVDHIKPCSKFDLTKPEEQKKCFHYTNLQPLWWRDNLIKGDKYEDIS
jgi:hypothetical protein